MRYYRLFAALALWSAVALTPALAVDCPALRFNDHASQVQGEEMLSNTAPLEFGVRLSWENPVDNKPVRSQIYRRELGMPFIKIGQTTNGTQTSYIDKTTSKTVPGYIYAIKSEFTCGDTLWSNPVVVLTSKRTMDDSAPLIQFILPQGSATVGQAEDVYVYIRDLESGVAEKTIKIMRGTTSIPAGANLGTPQHALFKISGSLLGTTDKVVSVSVSNGADVQSQKTINLTKGAAASAVSWTSPTAGSVLDLRLPLTLSWNISKEDTPLPSNLRLAYSTNFGTDWSPLEAGESGTTLTIQDPLTTLRGSKNASIIFFRVNYVDSGTTYGTSILPLFVGNTTLHFTSPANNIAIPTGNFSLYDGLKGTKITFPAETPFTAEKDKTQLTMQQQEAVVALKPGFYALEEYMDNFVLPAATDPVSVLQFNTGTNTITIPVYPYLQFISDRKALTADENAIIEGTMEPQALRDALAAYEKKKSIKAVELVKLTDPVTPTASVDVTAMNCSDAGGCSQLTYKGASPLKLLWDATTNTFANASGTGTSLTATSPILPGMLSLESQGMAIHIPLKVMTLAIWSPAEPFQLTVTPTGLRWDFPALFVKIAQSMTGFIKVSMPLKQGEICTDVLLQRRDISGNIVPLPTLCATDRVVAVVLPFEQTELQSTKPSLDIPILQGTVWYVPYMNQFQLWGMLFQQEDINHGDDFITRGELAYLLHKAFQYPTGAYKAEALYTDLPATHTFAPYILGMVTANIMSGDATAKTVRPDDLLNRAEALKMILTAAHLQGALPNHLFTGQQTIFADVPADAWFTTFVNRGTSLNMISGYTEGGKRLFKPSRNVSRAEALKIIYAALEKKALE